MSTPKPTPGTMEHVVFRNLLLDIVQQTLGLCPHCQGEMEVERTVFVEYGSDPENPRAGHRWYGCTKCWGRSPFWLATDRWTVIDGRVLYPPRLSRRRHERRAAQARRNA
jgi:hypothetical protein